MKVIITILSALLFFPLFSNATGKDNASSHIQTLVLGSGCFWGAEKGYKQLEGVLDAESGYADGRGFKAIYKEIIKRKRRFDDNNYAEVVKVTYNANMLSTRA